jgi:hypothetical protein
MGVGGFLEREENSHYKSEKRDESKDNKGKEKGV